MVTTSFKPDDEVNGATPTWFPFHPTLAHYRDAMARPYFWDDVKNSLVIVLSAVLISMVLAFLAAVALAKYRFGGRKLFIVLMIGILMLPQVGLIIPLYVVLARYHLTNTLTGVILTYLTFVLPFAVWTLRGFILGIPKELEEAAMVDGSSRLGAFVRILLPLVAPGLVATSVFAFVTTWNEYIFASVLLSDQSNQTVTVWLSYFYGTSRNTDWGALMAASTLTAIPVDRLLPARAASHRLRPHGRLRRRDERHRSSGSRGPASCPGSPARRRPTGSCASSTPGSAGSSSSRATSATRSSCGALTASIRVSPETVVAIDEEGGDVTRLEAARGSSVPGSAGARRGRRTGADRGGRPGRRRRAARRRGSPTTSPRSRTSTRTR